ncbi:MAG: molybdate ABC transporter substrate-binding protein [Planctomycetota bacterium]
MSVLAGCAQPSHGVTVFAAASTSSVLPAIGAAYAATGQAAPRLSFAASSTVVRQVTQGAPAGLVVVADGRWLDQLPTWPQHAIASNRLVLISQRDAAPMSLGQLSGPLALGDPSHVPLGHYSEQALRHLERWDQCQIRPANDASAALRLVADGVIPRGIVYRSDARRSDRVRIDALLPADSHDPITLFAAADPSNPAALALLAFLRGPLCQATFNKNGFGSGDAQP